MERPSRIRFDGWTLHCVSGELTRQGRSARLPQQPLRFLLALLERPGEVVTREQLREEIWPRGVVDFDNGLNNIARRVRLALGDDSDTPRYVETLPRVGYRFLGKVVAGDPPPGDAADAIAHTRAHRLRWLPVALACALGATSIYLLKRDTSGSAAPPSTLSAAHTTSSRAYEHYLQAIYHRSRRDTNANPMAIREFEAAIREDPEYAEAWAGLSDAYMSGAIGHELPPATAFPRAKKASEQALALQPRSAEAHTSLGHVLMLFDRNYPRAETEYAIAGSLNAGFGRLWHHTGLLRGFEGRVDEALASMRRARELEPMNLLYSSNYGLLLYHARRFDEAIAHVRPLLDAQPSLYSARSVLIRSLVATGDLEGAQRELALQRDLRPNLSDAGLVHAHLGRRAEAMADVAAIEAMERQGLGVGYEIAVVRAALGDVNGGCAALEEAVGDYSPFIGWLKLDPRMDPLRSAPCFTDISKRLYGK